MIHEGHRERIRAKAIKFGFECLAEHEILEMLLFYPIQRQNTNETAHKLIEMSGSLRGVFDLESSDLKNVKGVGDNVVLFLKLIKYVLNLPKASAAKRVDLNKFSAVCQYADTLFKGSEKEELYALMLDKKLCLMKTVKITSGNSWQIGIDKKAILKAAVETEAAAIILMHNHPNGVSRPSSEDISFTIGMERACNAIDLPFIEHIVYSEGDCHPIMMRSKLTSTKSIEYDTLDL